MTIPAEAESLLSSFRDPSGFLFRREGRLFRQVNRIYAGHFDLLNRSGLYDLLTNQNLLVHHETADIPPADPDGVHTVIRPEEIPFISFPFEWSFSQLKDAALLTLRIQRESLKQGMSLKDATAYNIQFRDNAPILIDTLSFEKYTEGRPWVAYRQFCQHFLAPLALMARVDIRLQQLLRAHIDGLPLDLASRLLPRRTWLSPGLLFHLHLHARSQRRYSDSAAVPVPSDARLSQHGLLAILDSLEGAIRSLRFQTEGTEWGDYYRDTNYSENAHAEKKRLVRKLALSAAPRTAWDMGANDGTFSRILAAENIRTTAFDIDPVAVEKNYLKCKGGHEKSPLPLLLDITNPSPGIGWANEERPPLLKRGKPDLLLALALIHHLSITHNLPFSHTSRLFSGMAGHLLIEFVPKSDSQVQRLLRTREDIFPGYTQPEFEKSFGKTHAILAAEKIPETDRTLYLMKSRAA